MAAQENIYDEIVQCLRDIRKQTPALSVSQEVMQEFMRDYPREKEISAMPAAVPAPPAEERVFQQREEVQRERFSETSASMPVSVQNSASAVTAGPSAEEVALMDFEELHSSVRSCTKCKLCSARTNTVFEDGSRQADLLFLGEGPGADEDAQGVPFVGKAGQLLTKMIQAMQFERKEVYICNVVKCRPPANRNPEADEVTACLPYMKRQIELVNPKVIVILGAVPLRALFPKIYGGIKSLRGRWMQYNNIPVMPTYHPAFLLRDPSAKREAWADLQLVMAHLGKTLPSKTR